MSADLAGAMEATALAIEAELGRLLAAAPEVPDHLLAAMRHAVLGGGKRLRPFLVAATGALFGATPEACRRAGAAVELIHCYSLVHDDLPAMDDAALRRGRPTCHKAFGEATAILVGDALQALAFEVLAADDYPADAGQRCALVAGLARAAGAGGMCGGQELDLAAEGASLDLEAIATLQRLKTGAMIAFAADAGCILGRGPEAERRQVGRYAAALGLAFQIKDDLLDVAGDSAVIGKDAGRDAERGKATFVTALGIEGAERRLGELRLEAFAAINGCGRPAPLLHELFDYVIRRKL